MVRLRGYDALLSADEAADPPLSAADRDSAERDLARQRAGSRNVSDTSVQAPVTETKVVRRRGRHGFYFVRIPMHASVRESDHSSSAQSVSVSSASTRPVLAVDDLPALGDPRARLFAGCCVLIIAKGMNSVQRSIQLGKVKVSGGRVVDSFCADVTHVVSVLPATGTTSNPVPMFCL